MVLSLDPSLRATGWSVFDHNQLIDYGCIVTKKGSGFADLEKIAVTLVSLISKYSITEILFEYPAGSKSSVAAAALAAVKGIVIGIAFSHSITPKDLKARQVKKYLGVNSAEKEDVFVEVTKRYLFSYKNKVHKYAISDAIGIFICYKGL